MGPKALFSKSRLGWDHWSQLYLTRVLRLQPSSLQVLFLPTEAYHLQLGPGPALLTPGHLASPGLQLQGSITPCLSIQWWAELQEVLYLFLKEAEVMLGTPETLPSRSRGCEWYSWEDRKRAKMKIQTLSRKLLLSAILPVNEQLGWEHLFKATTQWRGT